jgi:hypothetical protein
VFLVNGVDGLVELLSNLGKREVVKIVAQDNLLARFGGQAGDGV